MARRSFIAILSLSLLFIVQVPLAWAEHDQTPHKVVRFGVIDLEPYYIPNMDADAGLYNEATKHIISQSYIRAEIVYLPPSRLISAFNKGLVDAALFADVIAQNNPAFISLGIVFPNANNSIVTRKQDPLPDLIYLKARTVVVPSLRVAKSMQQKLPNIVFEQVHNYPTALTLLQQERVEGVLGLEPTLRHFARIQKSAEDYHYIVITKGEVELFRSAQSVLPEPVWSALSATVKGLYDQDIFLAIAQNYLPGWQIAKGRQNN